MSVLKRAWKVYITTFKVIFSYLWLLFLGKLLGEDFFQARISELHKKNAKFVLNTIIELKGFFIKAGQLISILTNFLPEEFRIELESLQDKVPPRPYLEIAQRIREELKKEVEELFLEFDKEPIASASIAQVHKGKLKSGELVAVKVQHIGLESLVKTDLTLLKRALFFVQLFLPVKNLMVYYKQIKEMIEEELDFTHEIKNMESIRENFRNNPKVNFPKVYKELSTKKVLITEYIEGVKVSDIEKLDRAAINRKELARLIIETYCQMIFIDGLFHADPHPGNILVLGDGSIVFLDFGAVGRLSERMKKGAVKFVEGVIKRDTQLIIDSLKQMGFLAEKDPETVIELIIEYFYSTLQEEIQLESLNLKDIKVDPNKAMEKFMDFRKLDIGLRELSKSFQIPKDWVLLERTLLLIGGVCTTLDPELNPVKVVYPYLQEFVLGKDKDWTALIVETSRDLILSLVGIPKDIRKFISASIKGEIRYSIRGAYELRRVIYGITQQFIYILSALFFGYLSYDSWKNNTQIQSTIFLIASLISILLYLGSRLSTRKFLKKRL